MTSTLIKASGLTANTYPGPDGGVYVFNGSVWLPLVKDPMTTRGDIIYRDSSGFAARRAVGSVGQSLVSDGTDPTYSDRNLLQTPSRSLKMREDFTGGVLANGYPFALQTNGASANGATTGFSGNEGEAAHPGIARFTTGTAASPSYAGVSTKHTQAILLGGGKWAFESEFYIPALSTGTEDFTLKVGFWDTLLSVVDGCYIVYNHATNSGKFACRNISNSTNSGDGDSGVTAAINTWYRARVEVDAAASSVAYYINGALVATKTNDIPSGAGRQVGAGIQIIKSATAGVESLLYCDYVDLECAFSAER